jgi:hypothetical protein
MTTGHTFCKIQAKLNIRRLRRKVASEKGPGLLQSLHFVYQRVSITWELCYHKFDASQMPINRYVNPGK